MMFYGQPGSTRAALLLEVKDKDGNPQVMIYHLAEPIMMQMEQDFGSLHYNLFDGASRVRNIPAKLTVEAYLTGPPQEYSQPMPGQEEIEPAQLAIESNESEIVIDEEGFESWQQED